MFLDYVDNGDSRYFVLFTKPIFIKMSVSKGCVEKYKILNEIDTQVGQFTKLFYYNGKILVVPLHSSSFIVYDEKQDEIRKIYIPKIEISSHPYGYFSMAIQKGKYVYAFGINYFGIVRVDIENEQAQCICELEAFGVINHGFTGEMVVRNEKAYLPIAKDTKLALFDAEEEKLEIIETGVGGNKIIKTICEGGDFFVLVMNDGTAYEFNITSGAKRSLFGLENLLKEKPAICHGADLNDDIFLFPEKGNEVLIYSCKNQKGRWIHPPLENTDSLRFYYVKSTKDILTFYDEDSNLIYSYNQKIDDFERSSLQLSGKDYLEIMIKETKIIKENKSAALGLYLSEICNSGGNR